MTGQDGYYHFAFACTEYAGRSGWHAFLPSSLSPSLGPFSCPLFFFPCLRRSAPVNKHYAAFRAACSAPRCTAAISFFPCKRRKRNLSRTILKEGRAISLSPPVRTTSYLGLLPFFSFSFPFSPPFPYRLFCQRMRAAGYDVLRQTEC